MGREIRLIFNDMSIMIEIYFAINTMAAVIGMAVAMITC